MGGKAAIPCKKRKNKSVFFLLLLLLTSAKFWPQLSGPSAAEIHRGERAQRLPAARCWSSTRGCACCCLSPTARTLQGVMGSSWGSVSLQVSVFKLWHVSCESVVILLVRDCLSPAFPDHFPSKIQTKGFPGTLCTCCYGIHYSPSSYFLYLLTTALGRDKRRQYFSQRDCSSVASI